MLDIGVLHVLEIRLLCYVLEIGVLRVTYRCAKNKILWFAK